MRGARETRARTLAGVALLAAGVLLSRAYEPGVRVEWARIEDGALEVPAIRFEPSGAPVGTALLLHGAFASKETMVVLGEALARAGMSVVAIDLPGHGAAGAPARLGRGGSFDEDARRSISVAARALAQRSPASDSSAPRVDLVVGHSMGAYVGASALRLGDVAAPRFVALGARPDLEGFEGRVLLASGREDELLSPEHLERSLRGGEELLIVDACDHAIETWHPEIIAAVVERATSSTVATHPPARASLDARRAEGASSTPRTRWLARLLGPLLATLGAALILAAFLARRPTARPWLSAARGALVALAAIAVLAATMTPWLGVQPSLRAVPTQALFAGVFFAVCRVLSSLVRRSAVTRAALSLVASALVAALVVAARGQGLLALVLVAAALVLLLGAGVAKLAELGTSTALASSVAFSLSAGYAIGLLVRGPL